LNSSQWREALALRLVLRFFDGVASSVGNDEVSS